MESHQRKLLTCVVNANINITCYGVYIYIYHIYSVCVSLIPLSEIWKSLNQQYTRGSL